MGLSNAFVSLGRIVGPVWGGLALDIQAGLPYLSGAFVLAVGFGLSLVWLPKKQPGRSQQIETIS
jgi:DHA1 family multidrug resistance protein-like MFS transporter